MSVCLAVFVAGKVPVPYIALIDGVTMGGVSDNFFVFFIHLFALLYDNIDFEQMS